MDNLRDSDIVYRDSFLYEFMSPYKSEGTWYFQNKEVVMNVLSDAHKKEYLDNQNVVLSSGIDK